MAKITIQEAENGFIITNEIKAENEKTVEIFVIEDNDDDNETMINLLKKISECFGIFYNKYNENNLNISFNKKGHKVE